MGLTSTITALGSIDAQFDTDWDGLAVRDRLTVLEELETLTRRTRALSHEVIDSLARDEVAVLGDVPDLVIADRLRITPAEARRRIRDAAQLAPRSTLIGEPLPPELPVTAEKSGLLDGEHLTMIQRFMRHLPDHIGPDVAEASEAFLADKATVLRRDQLAKAADRLATYVNPDGVFSEADRARKRGFTWGSQGPDGMSQARLVATPELRANLEAWFAKYAAPGRCNPDDQTPAVNDEPSTDAAQRDVRTVAQRQHDALNTLVHTQLGSRALGVHNGLPVTAIVSTTIRPRSRRRARGDRRRDVDPDARPDQHGRAQPALVSGLRQHTEFPLYLGRAQRFASPAQRLMLYAKDRGCTKPNCTVPAYYCEVHHATADWANGGQTNINDLTLACGPDNRSVKPDGWTTRKRKHGHTEWIPPPQLEQPPGSNDFHHPENYLTDDDG